MLKIFQGFASSLIVQYPKQCVSYLRWFCSVTSYYVSGFFRAILFLAAVLFCSASAYASSAQHGLATKSAPQANSAEQTTIYSEHNNTSTPLYASPLTNTNLYLGLSAGPSIFIANENNKIDALYNHHTKTGFNIGGVIGYQLADFLRTDLSIDYTHNHFTGGSASYKDAFSHPQSIDISAHDLNQLHIMLNGYFQYHIRQLHYKLRPYVGTGIGFAHLAQAYYSTTQDQVGGLDSDNTTGSNNGIAWQFSLGAKYAISKDVDIGLDYRVLGTFIINPHPLLNSWRYVDPDMQTPLKNTLNSIVALSFIYRVL